MSSIRKITLATWLIFPGNPLFAQSHGQNELKQDPLPKNPLSYADPFIGTSTSNVFTKWGSEGGTYPGAVAPWGYLQLTPETRPEGGYDHKDSSIYFFTCTGHMSGYPNGSAGQMKIMPVGNANDFHLGRYHRPFLHRDERATPGYYRVLFPDDNTLVEATATEHAGLFRFSFPAHVSPVIFVETFPGVMRFSETIRRRERTEGGLLLYFTSSVSGIKTILLKIGVSAIGMTSAQKNIDADVGEMGFDQVRKMTTEKWRRQLSVIEIADSNEQNKKIFYSALYHSLLLPWIVSDAEGNYRGRDGHIHRTAGKNEYGGFSPWDTFRSLHPLLCLLFPDRQKDMILSMMDIYRQTGRLPTGPMTGEHVVPVLVDSWMKGIRAGGSALVFAAMKKSLAQTPFPEADRKIYRRQGYIPYSYPESVTRTVEYAYDDWALARFAGRVMGNHENGDHLLQASYNYRNLFFPQELLLVPRQGEQFFPGSGAAGYKEGDKWVYSYFVPQHPGDLVNLMGGNRAFTQRLDSALARQTIVFDNETVFHIPYLFNYSGRPDKTQQWVRAIMESRFSASPGGLPGNDDLGSVSSWYVFSAMGIYPLCPGRPVYAIGSPLFRSMSIHLSNGKEFVIKAGNGSPQNLTDPPDPYVRSVLVNNNHFTCLEISHALILKGGVMAFTMSKIPVPVSPRNDPDPPVFVLSDLSVSKTKLSPNELFWLRFSLANRGSTGTQILTLRGNVREYAGKNCLLYAGASVVDSIGCRLYRFGKETLYLKGMEDKGEKDSIIVEVENREDLQATESGSDSLRHLEISGLAGRHLIKTGEIMHICFDAFNTGGADKVFHVPVEKNDAIACVDTLHLDAGEKRKISLDITAKEDGMQTIRIKGIAEHVKVYSEKRESSLLDLSTDRTIGDSLVRDDSGFGSSGRVIRPPGEKPNKGRLLFGKNCFVEIPNSCGSDSLGETITMMAWVYPMAGDAVLVDLLANGDNHVLQILDNKSLSFFAGGWGRGVCTIDLPENWRGHWHHIAGVCDGSSLSVYMDGERKGTVHAEGRVNLSAPNKWTLGRNEEFPGQRIFNGFIDKVKVFAAPLSGEDIYYFSRQHPG